MTTAGYALANATHPDRFGIDGFGAARVSDQFGGDVQETNSRPSVVIDNSYAPPWSGLTKPDTPPRPAQMNQVFTVRSFGHWLRETFTGAHVDVRRPQYTAPNGVQAPMYQQVRELPGRRCTWDTVTIGKV